MTRPLCGLRELDLSRNSLACFPVALCHLPSLELLDMSLNLLESVDVSAELVKSGLPKLQKLLLSRNRLTAFPQCLPGCMHLEALDLSHNRLGFAMTGSDAADPLRGTAKLRELCLNDNGLLQVPPAVFALPLEVLRVGGNRLSALPPSIAGLAGSLTSLDIGRNSLSALPPQLGTCDLLSQLAVDANPLTWPPADVMKKPLPKILAWLREQLRMPAPPPVDRAALAAAAAKAARESLIAALRAEALAVRSCLTKRSAELAELQARCAGAVAALSECEAATTAASRLLEAERASTMERMELEQKGVADAAARVASIPKRHLEELRQLNNPPKTVMRTLQAVHLLLDAAENPASGSRLRQAVEAVQAAASPPASAVAKLRIAAQRVSAGAKVAPAPKVVGGVTTAGGDKAAWETVRGTLQRNFVSRVTKFDASRVTAAACTAVRAALPAGSDALETVTKASVACAPLWTWAHASLELADSMLAATTGAEKIDALQAEVDGLRDRQLASESELREVSALRLLADVEVEAVRVEADAADAAVTQAMDAGSSLTVEDVAEEEGAVAYRWIIL